MEFNSVVYERKIYHTYLHPGISEWHYSSLSFEPLGKLEKFSADIKKAIYSDAGITYCVRYSTEQRSNYEATVPRDNDIDIKDIKQIWWEED